MKHGRRHDSLKEKTYRERAAQDAPGYKRAYDPIDVREPDEPKPLPKDPAAPLAAKLGRKAKKQLEHLGVDPDEADDAER
jgi:hypothetical protein